MVDFGLIPEYGERVGLEHATFTPLIFGTNDGMGAE